MIFNKWLNCQKWNVKTKLSKNNSIKSIMIKLTNNINIICRNFLKASKIKIFNSRIQAH